MKVRSDGDKGRERWKRNEIWKLEIKDHS